MTDWHRHLIASPEGITALLERVRTVAVLGIKTPASGAPAYWVPEYAQQAGMRVIPVPVYYPDVTEILGERVHRTVAGIGEPVDLVNVFRRPADIPPHVDDIIAAKPRAVWFQLGIRNDAAAERLARAGIDVVQDRCLLVELQERGR
jgi:uncharacterized protein